MQNKLKLINSIQTWNAKKRYKINEVATVEGIAYQNTTGVNSDPTTLVDWYRIPDSLFPYLITDPLNDQFLQFNGAIGKWVNTFPNITSQFALTSFDLVAADLATQDVAGMVTYINAIDPAVLVPINSLGIFEITDNGGVFLLKINNAYIGDGSTPVTADDIICLNKPSKFKVYKALLTQSGTSAPVATVLENTLGGTPVWAYLGVGTYKATLAGAFPPAKCAIYPGVARQFSLNQGREFQINRNNTDNADADILIGIVRNSAGTAIDDALYETLVYIEVYY